MNDSAHEQCEPVVIGDTELPLVGCSKLLSDTEIGSRVRYEGKIVHFDPQPREASLTRDPAQSPCKRAIQRTTITTLFAICFLEIIRDPFR